MHSALIGFGSPNGKQLIIKLNDFITSNYVSDPRGSPLVVVVNWNGFAPLWLYAHFID